jgi:opacity protein-like surface antigen
MRRIQKQGFPTAIETRGGAMRRFTAAALMIFLFVLVLSSASHAGFGIRVTGPTTHLSLGQFNDYVDAFNSEFLSGTPYSWNNLTWVPEFGGEILYDLTPMLDIGVGAGIILSTSELSISAGLESSTEKHKLRCYPFTATCYIDPAWSLGPFKPFFYAGAGLYYTNWDYSSAYMGTMEDFSYEWETSKWGFGFHGGAGFEISILPKLSVDIGFKGRWSKFKGLEGKDPITGEDVVLAAGTLEFEEGDPPEIYIVPIYQPISTEFVSETETLDEADVDLSGYSIVLGIKVKF